MSKSPSGGDDPNDLNPDHNPPRPFKKVKVDIEGANGGGAQDEIDDHQEINPLVNIDKGDGQEDVNDNINIIPFPSSGVKGAGDPNDLTSGESSSNMIDSERGAVVGDGGGDDDDNDDIDPINLTIDDGDTCVQDGNDNRVVNIEDGSRDNEDDINPFLINEVVRVMMSQMSIEDLKKCRSVSSEWDQAGSAELYKLSPLLRPPKFWNLEKFENFTKLMRNSPATRQFVGHPTDVYLGHISRNEFEFLQIIKPQMLSINIGVIYMEKLIELFQKCGNVKILKIDGWLNIGGEITWPENLKFPQLEELKVNIKTKKREIFPSPRVIQDDDYILDNLIKTSPKLTRLSLVNEPMNPNLWFHFGSLDILRHSGTGILKNLQELTIYVDTNEFRVDIANIPEKLIEMSNLVLRLKKFKMDFRYYASYSDPDISIPPTRSFYIKLSQFLSSQSESLESLSMNIWLYDRQELVFWNFGKFKFPQMSQLKVLEVKNHPTYGFIAFDQNDLPSCFPQLKEIEIDLEYDLDDIFHGVSESVEKLTIKIRTGKNDFGNLRKNFPNVKWFSVISNQGYQIPYNIDLTGLTWTTTLTNITLRIYDQDHDLEFGYLLHLRELKKLEIQKQYNRYGTDREGQDDENKILNINLESLSRTSVSYLKIKNFRITPTLESQLREKYILDYAPPVPTSKYNVKWRSA